MNAIFPAIVEKIETRQDKSLKVTLSTQEPRDDMASRLFGMHQNYVKVLLTNNNVTEEIEQQLNELELTVDIKKGKSPGTRLRNVLFLLWRKTAQDTEFESFYETNMERIINAYKEKLN